MYWFPNMYKTLVGCCFELTKTVSASFKIIYSDVSSFKRNFGFIKVSNKLALSKILSDLLKN